MSEWKEVIASDFCTEVTDGTHDSPKPVSVGKYLLTSKHLQEYSLDFANAYMISEEDYNKVILRSKVEQYDILFSMIGTIGTTHRVKISNVDFAVKNMGIFKLGGNCIKSKWLYYWLKTRESKEYINSCLSGTTQGYMTLKALRNFPIAVPDSLTMESITSILSSFDDKIAVNKKICENLEAQAQALFKHWFVDFAPFKDGKFVESELGLIPEGWRVCTLGEICKCELGGTPSRANKSYWGGNIAWINSGEVNKFRICEASEFITEDGLNHSATKLLPAKTTVLAITGATLGQVSLLEIDSCANQSVVGVKENETIPYTFIYPAIKCNIGKLVNMQTGGAQQHINKDNIQSLQFIEPPKNIMEEYKLTTLPIYEEIGKLCFENLRLATLRDTLLPKLMSGEIPLE